MTPAEVKAFIRESGLGRFTPRTITRASALADELEKIRKQDYATSIGEISTDLFGVAAPVRDREETMVASVNLAGPIFRLGNRLPRLSAEVRKTARQISLDSQRVSPRLGATRAFAS